MRAWKKIVYLLGCSTCAAVLGAACTAEVTDRADSTGSVEPTEDAVAPEAPASAASVPIETPRERCEVECRDRFRCERDRWEERRRCEREREECLERCRRLP
jgi:hypothetical protein